MGGEFAVTCAVREPGQVRIGVAITVPSPFSDELRAARLSYGDPLAEAIPAHITVVGPTVVAVSDLPAVDAHLAAVAAAGQSFVIHLRSTGTFRPVTPVVFVQVAAGIPQTEALEAAARRGPLAQELRYRFHPHVTVAHEVADSALDRAFDELADYEASFAVNTLDLYEHGDDNVWRRVRAYPLGATLDDEFATALVGPPAP